MEHYKLYLNGRWIDLKQRFAVTDPGTGEAFAEVPAATREHAGRAIGDANEAFNAWRSPRGTFPWCLRCTRRHRHWLRVGAYAYTNDLNRAWRLAEGLEAGTIVINDAVPSTSNAPFGGMKESGLGRELGSEGLEAFLETKHISFGAALIPG